MAEAKKAPSGILAPIEQIVMPIANAIPVSQVKAWLSAFFRPMETFEANKKESNFVGIAVHFVLIGLLSALVGLLTVAFSLNFGAIIIMLPMIIIMPILVVIFGFLGSLIEFVIAKIFGGKGGFMDQTLALALIYGGAIALSAPFQALSGIPLIGFLLGLPALFISLYNIYNSYLVIKGVHQLSSIKAALVVLIPIIIVVGLMVVAAAFFAMMLATVGSFSGPVGMSH